MRSPTFTVLLVLLTLLVGGMATVRFSEGNLNRLFGVPPSKEGERLYNFDPKRIHRILLAGNDVRAECVFEQGSWKIVSPWKDRMDPRVADAILNFTLGAKVVDTIPNGKLNDSQAGLIDGNIEVRIEDSAGEPLAKYRLGRRTAVKFYDEKEHTEEPTVFVQPRDKNRKDYIYACTGGNIHLVLKDGFRFLRDHHPFNFHPYVLETVRIQNSDGGPVLKHTAPDTKEKKEPWRIVSPLEDRTDPGAVGTLLSDLFNLQAQRVLSRSEVTLPPAEAGKGETIALKNFGETQETVLEIYPPATPDAETVHATVSTRPDAVFELIRKPVSKGDDGIVSLANLPDTVNELRNQMLTNIGGGSLGGIMISPSTGPAILLARDDAKSDFKVELDGKLQPPNLNSLQNLIQLITKARVSRFVDDTATDLAPYGLDRPSVALTFQSFGDERIVLNFGRGLDGTWYMNRVGTSTVVKVEDSVVSLIKIHPWDWRNSILWSVSPVDLKGIKRQIGNGPELSLSYDFPTETWTAQESGRDRSAEINNIRANRMLETLVNLRVARWLAPDDEEAAKALLSPAMVLTIATQPINAQGQAEGLQTRHLQIAPSSNAGTIRTFYAHLEGEPSLFELSQADIRNLTANVFGDD